MTSISYDRSCPSIWVSLTVIKRFCTALNCHTYGLRKRSLDNSGKLAKLHHVLEDRLNVNEDKYVQPEWLYIRVESHFGFKAGPWFKQYLRRRCHIIHETVIDRVHRRPFDITLVLKAHEDSGRAGGRTIFLGKGFNPCSWYIRRRRRHCSGMQYFKLPSNMTLNQYPKYLWTPALRRNQVYIEYTCRSNFVKGLSDYNHKGMRS